MSFLDELFDILRIPSIYSNDCAPFGSNIKKCLHYMIDLANKDGFITKNVNDYACHIEYGSGAEILGILCHIDVVSANGWKKDPFSPYIVNNRIYARGANDDKGPLMAAYYALKELKEENFKPNKKIRLIIGCNEEIDSTCIKEYLKYEKTPDLAFSPDADYPVIYGEKAILSVDIVGKSESDIIYIKSINRYNIVPNEVEFKLNIDLTKEFDAFLIEKNIKGKCVNDIYTIYGITNHAMHPDKGLNAIYLTVEFLSKYVKDDLISFIDKYFNYDHFGYKLKNNCYDEEMKNLTMNLAIIDYENNSFRLGLNYRIPTIENYELTIKKLNELPYDYKIIDYMEPHYVSPNSYLVKTLLEVYQRNTNDYKNKPFTIGGGTYAKFIPNCVAFGVTFPNAESTAHIVDEYQDIDELKLSIKIFKDAIRELTK